jgi:hypothetical protein
MSNYTLYEFNDAAGHNTCKPVLCVDKFTYINNAIVIANALQSEVPNMTYMILDKYGRQQYATKNYNNDNYVSA